LQANERLTEFPPRFCGTHDNGDVLHIKQRDRGQLPLPPLPLQYRPSKEGFMQIGLVCDRGSKLQEINNIFITQNLIDLHLVGSGSYVFPLYLYNKEQK